MPATGAWRERIVKIQHVDTIVTKIDLTFPVRIATKTLTHRYYIICSITTDQGVSGWGYCWGVPSVAHVIRDDLTPLLVGEDPFKTEFLWKKMYAALSVWGRRGISARALGAVDIALWDLKGKACGLPIHEIIGGYRTSVPAYYSGGYYPVRFETDREFIGYIDDEFGRYREKGFKAFKMKIGGGSTALDLARATKAREVIGPDSDLMLDANNAWSPEQAIDMARRYEHLDIKWFEEPVAVDDIHGLARVKEKVSMPVAAGENHATRWDFKEMIEKKAVDIIQGDPTLMGGITEWLKLAGLACSFGITLCPHWTHDVNVQVGAASPLVEILEYFDLEEDIFNFGRLLQNPVKAKNGEISPPEGSGHGLVLDEKAVSRHRIM